MAHTVKMAAAIAAHTKRAKDVTGIVFSFLMLNMGHWCQKKKPYRCGNRLLAMKCLAT